MMPAGLGHGRPESFPHASQRFCVKTEYCAQMQRVGKVKQHNGLPRHEKPSHTHTHTHTHKHTAWVIAHAKPFGDGWGMCESVTYIMGLPLSDKVVRGESTEKVDLGWTCC